MFALFFLTSLLADSTFVLAAKRTQALLRIDGVIDSTEWAGAAAVAQPFLQYAPRRGEAATQRTEVFVSYDSTHLYVAFRVFDDNDPTSQLTRRDADLLNDDAVVLLLDTYHDRQSGYYFITNLLGTQADGRIADDGRTVDGSWDASWRSAARRTTTGWEAELAIPLASVAFRPGEQRSWGINFGRSRRRTLELSYWAGPLDNAYRMSQAGHLEGLDLTPPPKRHQVIAYGLTRI
ncbi:MAG: carbohydrate binding family 9 domain-containing protein, partial [Gemmatimonadaceae bacterium]